jgi:polar amino acid transport system ATP-binding protein
MMRRGCGRGDLELGIAVELRLARPGKRRGLGVHMSLVTPVETAAAATAPVLRLERINKSFGRHQVLCDVTLEVQRGEVVCIIGPSGAGKSTLLRCINHLENVDSGTVFFEGAPVYRYLRGGRTVIDPDRRIEKIRSHIGMVFQSFNLFPHLTALGNVIEAPINVRHDPPEEAKRQGMAVLTKVGLAVKANSYPHQLSGGQQQRVAVARALVGDPLILMADEPTGNLDSRNGEAVMELLRDLHRNGATICMVTHDERYSHFAERTIRLFDGRIVEETQEAHASA